MLVGKNATVSTLFHLPLGTTQVCILVYSPRSGITGLASLLLTSGVEHPGLAGERWCRRGKSPSFPQGITQSEDQPNQSSHWKFGVRNWQQHSSEALRGPHPSRGLLVIDVSGSWLSAGWRLYFQCMDRTGPYFLVFPPFNWVITLGGIYKTQSKNWSQALYRQVKAETSLVLQATSLHSRGAPSLVRKMQACPMGNPWAFGGCIILCSLGFPSLSEGSNIR